MIILASWQGLRIARRMNFKGLWLRKVDIKKGGSLAALGGV
jgi:hypothetical protein